MHMRMHMSHVLHMHTHMHMPCTCACTYMHMHMCMCMYVHVHVRPPPQVIFNVIGYSKTKSLYRDGMAPVVSTSARPHCAVLTAPS